MPDNIGREPAQRDRARPRAASIYRRGKCRPRLLHGRKHIVELCEATPRDLEDRGAPSGSGANDTENALDLVE